MYQLNVPTDNLYKFISIAGLVLAIISFIFLTHRAEIFVERLFASSMQYVILSKKLNHLEEDIDKLIENSSQLTKEQLIKAVSTKKIEFRQYELESVRLQNLHEENQFYIEEFRNELRSFTKLIYASLAASFIGFLLWYLMLQRHLDVLAKKKAS